MCLCEEMGRSDADVAVMRTEGPVPSPPAGWTWEGLMERALSHARKSASEGEIPVGALVVTAQGRIVGEAGNAGERLHDPSAHAEILALREAGRVLGSCRLGGCILVVTLEPCTMCAAALVHARIDGVVFGARDALAGALVSREEVFDWPFLNHHPWRMGGVASEGCAGILRSFFQSRR